MAKKFTARQREIAIEVMLESRYVRNWVKSQAKFLNIDLDSEEGKRFSEREARKAAELIIQ